MTTLDSKQFTRKPTGRVRSSLSESQLLNEKVVIIVKQEKANETLENRYNSHAGELPALRGNTDADVIKEQVQRKVMRVRPVRGMKTGDSLIHKGQEWSILSIEAEETSSASHEGIVRVLLETHSEGSPDIGDVQLMFKGDPLLFHGDDVRIRAF